MTQEWKPLNTLQEVASAQAAGEEIEYLPESGAFTHWDVNKHAWCAEYSYRSRLKKQTKTIVLREALIDSKFIVIGTESFLNEFYCTRTIQWLDTPERVIEVEE